MLLVQTSNAKNLNINPSFNTLYVVGSKKNFTKKNSLIKVSIHYMLLVQLQKYFNFNHKFTVSIHYMLLVQGDTFNLFASSAPFQYIICCWFNIAKAYQELNPYEFQYIICCWFKNFKKSTWRCNPVSIHYMLLVQKINLLAKKAKLGFNTLYVVGSSSNKTFSILSSMLFQYIICCWFNLKHHTQLNVLAIFNTLYVVGSTFPSQHSIS